MIQLLGSLFYGQENRFRYVNSKQGGSLPIWIFRFSATTSHTQHNNTANHFNMIVQYTWLPLHQLSTQNFHPSPMAASDWNRELLGPEKVASNENIFRN